MVTGRLEINNGTISIPCEGGMRVKDNPNNTLADSYKGARADALKHACKWLGLGLCMGEPKFIEQSLVYYGKQTDPGNLTQNLMKYLKVNKEKDISKALKGLDIEFSEWELKSKDRVVALIGKVKRLGNGRN